MEEAVVQLPIEDEFIFCKRNVPYQVDYMIMKHAFSSI